MFQNDATAVDLRSVETNLWNADAALNTAAANIGRSDAALPGVPSLAEGVRFLLDAVTTLRSVVARIAEVTE
jgi:hypothetical protein